jgi:hypothetical protein
MRAPFVLAFAAGVLACSTFDSASSDAVPDAGNDAGPDSGNDLRGPAEDLATNQKSPAGIVVDESNVYWVNQAPPTEQGAIMRIAKTGGTPFIVADMIRGPFALAADATRLFITSNQIIPADGNYQKLLRVEKMGGASPELLQLGYDGAISGCSVHAGEVFLTLAVNGGTVGYVLTDEPAWPSATPAIVASSVGNVKTVAADATHVFTGIDQQILMVERSGGAKAVFAKVSGAVTALVLDSSTSTLFWADASSVRALATNAPAATSPIVIASDQDGPSAIAVDGKSVYWTNVGGGTIRRAPKVGGGPVTTLSSGEGEPRGIAVDETGVYWTNHADGRVRVIRR